MTRFLPGLIFIGMVGIVLLVLFTWRDVKVDDLLKDANPLEDINNTREIRAVMVDGNFLDRETLDEMLEEVEGDKN